MEKLELLDLKQEESRSHIAVAECLSFARELAMSLGLSPRSLSTSCLYFHTVSLSIGRGRCIAGARRLPLSECLSLSGSQGARPTKAPARCSPPGVPTADEAQDPDEPADPGPAVVRVHAPRLQRANTDFRVQCPRSHWLSNLRRTAL